MQVPLVDLKTQYRQIQKEIQQAIAAVLEKQKFILDTEVRHFEEEIAKISQTRFAIGCASGTDAILLSLLALGIGEGDEVITTSFSFFSSAGMIAWLKARPVFVDIDPHTFHMRAEQVAGKITSKTKAILAVHLFGQCCDMERLGSFDIPVIEDAAQAIGASRFGRAAGSIGITGCFSFFPTKNLGGYGDGGIITTNSEEIAERIRELRAHGQISMRYLHHSIGTNSRLDELQAAVLRVKLNYLEEWNGKRRAHADFYRRELGHLPLLLPEVDSGNIHTYHQFVIRTNDRDKLKTALAEKGIATAVYYPVPIPLQPCFTYLGCKVGDFPHTEEIAASCLALPVYAELTEQQLEYVIAAIRNFFHG